MVSRIALFVVLYGFVLSPCRGDDAQEALARKVKVALAIEAAKPSPVMTKTLTAKKIDPLKVAAEPVKTAPAGSLVCTDGAVIAPDPTRPGVWVFVSGPGSVSPPVPATPIRSLYQLSAPCPDCRCPAPAKK